MKQSFSVNIKQNTLDDLKSRLGATRWTDDIDNDKWETGTNKTYLKKLCKYWENDFDWNKQENYLNTFKHYKTTISGSRIHFIHEKGKGNISIPLLLTHGYPDGFIRFLN